MTRNERVPPNVHPLRRGTIMIAARRFVRSAVLLAAMSVAIPFVFAAPVAAGALSATDGTWTRQAPFPFRMGESVIVDSLRHRLVMFGGRGDVDLVPWTGDLNDVWTMPLEGPPMWHKANPTGTPPSSRNGQSVIYDALRDRMLMFGGMGGDNVLYQLSLAGDMAWSTVSISGSPPAARRNAAAAYDPVRDRMLIFGGQRWPDDFVLNQVWVLSLSGTPAWTQILPPGPYPSPRDDPAMIYDPIRDRLVIYGGSANDQETWALDLSPTPAWVHLAPAGTPPSARTGARAIYDPLGDRMLLYAGESDTGSSPVALGDIWQLSLAGTETWTQIAVSGAPPNRFDHAVAYDPTGQRMVAVAGSGGTPRGDAWGFGLVGGASWTQITSGNKPGILNSGFWVYDSKRTRMISYTGTQYGAWSYSLLGPRLWTSLADIYGPSGVWDGGIYDPIDDRIVVFTGDPNGGLWQLTLSGTPTWSQFTASGTAPATRIGHSVAYDAMRHALLVFGGYKSPQNTLFNDVWSLSLDASPAWTQVAAAGTPPAARRFAPIVYDPTRDRITLFGGQNASNASYGDTWDLSLGGTPNWTQRSFSGATPAARSVMTSVIDPTRDRLIVYGGILSSGFGSDAWVLPLADGSEWALLNPDGVIPYGREYHSAAYDPVSDQMLIYGGYGPSNNWLNDGVHGLGWGNVLAVSGAAPNRGSVSLRVSPNPALRSILVRFSLARSGHVRLIMHDVTGRAVAIALDRDLPAGQHEARWDGRTSVGQRAAPGVYFAEIVTAASRSAQRFVVMR